MERFERPEESLSLPFKRLDSAGSVGQGPITIKNVIYWPLSIIEKGPIIIYYVDNWPLLNGCLMKTYLIKENKKFIGRKRELQIIHQLDQQDSAQILVCYGRRRVGKTELIEQAFRQSKILKFEGLQGKNVQEEINHFLEQLADYTQDPKLARLNYKSWKDCFELLSEYTSRGKWIIYLEELQWMACYESDLISELKFVWDNKFKRNDQLRLVLCGSATSFMLFNVVRSQALYNRSQTVIELKELSAMEAKMFLGPKHSNADFMDLYLCFGGIPEYLKKIKGGSSLLLKASEESFTRMGFFFTEIDRVFISQLADRKNYKRIIDFLSHHKFASREEILQHLEVKSGGKVSELIEDLEVCRFIEALSPLTVAPEKVGQSKLVRYQVSDAYLRFYYKFIHSKRAAVENDQYIKAPIKALNLATLRKWLGFAFEFWCLKNSTQISELLGFSDVEYRVGPFYNRKTEKVQKGYQLDLVFDRADRVISICEIKYTDKPVGKEILAEFNSKIELMEIGPRKTVQKVLISSSGAKEEIYNHFDRILTLDDLLRPH